MIPTDIQFLWFLLIGVLFAVYAILDGFDLGLGIWYLFVRKEEDRQTLRNSISPVWDGNEVWLIGAAGGLFAAFPLAYATVFSSLYLAVMILIWSLIFRALSLEFRNLVHSSLWKKAWDLGFVLGSFLPALLLGVALGNILKGLDLDASYNYTGTFFDLLNPFSLLIGLLGLLMFLSHGAAYLVARTEGHLYNQAKKWFFVSWMAYLILFLLVSAVIILTQQKLIESYNAYPIWWLIPFLGLVAILLTGYLNAKNYSFFSFISSASSILIMLLLAGISLYPNIVPALNADFSISISTAASSNYTLLIMLIIAIIGLPFIVLYTGYIYKTFIIKKITTKIGNY